MSKNGKKPRQISVRLLEEKHAALMGAIDSAVFDGLATLNLTMYDAIAVLEVIKQRFFLRAERTMQQQIKAEQAKEEETQIIVPGMRIPPGTNLRQ